MTYIYPLYALIALELGSFCFRSWRSRAWDSLDSEVIYPTMVQYNILYIYGYAYIPYTVPPTGITGGGRSVSSRGVATATQAGPAPRGYCFMRCR